MNNEITGAEIVLKSLAEQGVEVVFGYPGGAVLPIYDTLFKQNSIKHVLVRQEGGAIHAAEGYARSTGKTGVVLVTSGSLSSETSQNSNFATPCNNFLTLSGLSTPGNSIWILPVPCCLWIFG